MGIIASIGTWIAGKLFNVKSLAVLIVLLVLAYGQYRFYDWASTRAYASGVASQTKTIDGLNKELKTTKEDLANTRSSLHEWISRYNSYVAASTRQVADLQERYAATQATYTKQLTTLQATLAKTKKELENATSTYITAFGNAGCTIPVGFVQLYNLSLQETPNAGPTSAASLALARPAFSAYDVPSGLSLSDVARVIVVNNNAAVANRALVLGWQAWWKSVQADFEKYQQAHPQKPVAPPVSLFQQPKDIQRHVARSNDPIIAPFQSWGQRAPFLVAR